MAGGADSRYAAPLGAVLPLACALLAAVMLGQAALDASTMPGAVAPSLAAVDVALSLAAAAVAGWGHRCGGVPAPLAHPIAAGAAVAVTVRAVTVMVLGREPWQTVDVVLVVLVAAVALLPVRWFAGTLYVVWGAWIAGATVLGSQAQWPHFGLAMLVATGFAIGLNASRRSMVEELRAARELAEAIAVRDPLTGLPNRSGLHMLATPILESARRQGDAAHAVFLDVEGLGAIAGRLGRDVADDVVLAVAEALRGATRATDVVARWGDDEFCVVGPGPGTPPLELERRVRDRLLTHPPLAGMARITVGAGGAMLAPWDAGTLETLLQNADREMHLRRALRREDRTSDVNASD